MKITLLILLFNIFLNATTTPKVNAHNTIAQTTLQKSATLSKSMREIFSKNIAKITQHPLVKLGKKVAPVLPVIGYGIEIYQILNGTDPQSLIEKNKEYIQRVEREQAILGVDVEKNSRDVLNLNQDVEKLSLQITNINKIISKNSQNIKNVENGILETAIHQLENYFLSESNDIQSLQNSINNFEIIMNINSLNKETNSLVLNSLNIAYIEKSLQLQKSGKSFHFMQQKIITNFDKILNNANIDIVTTAFISTQELFLYDNDTKNILLQKFKHFYLNQLQQKFNHKKFEDALSLSKIYQTYTEDASLYHLAFKKREENFKHYKKNISASNIDKILLENQNYLLVQYSVKMLYSQDMYQKMIEILNCKKVGNSEFKIKAYYLGYRQIDKDKSNKLKHLILENKSYSSSLKNYIKGE